jgi:membrane-bound lytic murein transglycosylase A
VISGRPAVRLAQPPSRALVAVCEAALRHPDRLPRDEARRFFETRFRLRIAEPGFMTGYYEPEFAASPVETATHRTPMLGRPPDLVNFPPGETPPSHLAGLAGARRLPNGTLVPYPDRAAIEDGALTGLGLAMYWFEDPFDLFLIHVQGSARLRLPEGRTVRVGYAGRNGHAYTSVGRVLIDAGVLAREDVDLPRIRAVFAADPALARKAMRANRSYIFFRTIEGLDPDRGPLGAQGVPLTPFRSAAVDRNLHAYGLPLFVSEKIPGRTGSESFLRLLVAQDTGSAILGPARLDLFTGWGAEAERLAGVLRNAVSVTFLEPREDVP